MGATTARTYGSSGDGAEGQESEGQPKDPTSAAWWLVRTRIGVKGMGLVWALSQFSLTEGKKNPWRNQFQGEIILICGFSL